MPQDPNELVTVATYNDSMKAHLALSKLESEGIEAALFDDMMMGLNPIYNVAVGGVKLKTRFEDAERSVEILREIEESSHTDTEGNIIACPQCGSTQLYSDFNSLRHPKGLFGFLLSILTSTMPIATSKVYKCKECCNEFKVKS
jgi:hypothetical protein